MSDNGNRATYRYTAEDQRDIDNLRQKYAIAADEGHIERAREIDRKVTRRATKIAIIIGVAGTLILGAGLSLVLSYSLMLPGILIGCVGIAVMAAMPALFERILREERKKAAQQIRAILDLNEKDKNEKAEGEGREP